MIGFKKFINAIHDAILAANDELMNKNMALLDKYFISNDNSGSNTEGSGFGSTEGSSQENVLSAKAVVVEYPKVTDDGVEMTNVHVPLMTLAPMNMSQIEKAVLSSTFNMEIVNGDLQIDFVDKDDPNNAGKNIGTLEVTLALHEPAEGWKELVAGYEKALKQQLPH